MTKYEMDAQNTSSKWEIVEIEEELAETVEMFDLAWCGFACSGTGPA